MMATLALLFGMAAVAPFAGRLRGRALGGGLAVGLAAATVWLAVRYGPVVAAGGVAVEAYSWVPSLGVTWAFRMDGLALLFALLSTSVGALVCVHAGAYLDRHPERGRFFGTLLVFAAAMVGLVLADDVIVLFVFWELTSIVSFFLVGFAHHEEAPRRAARTALLVTGAGGLALLVGLLLLATITGTARLSEMPAGASAIRDHALYLPALLLVAAGAFTKSAQVPFHAWLPGAMAAPTPVSAYLHSATMVKAGVYLLARVEPTLGETTPWALLLIGVGGITMLHGAARAVLARDLKQVLAHSTVAALGTLVVLLGIGSDASVAAALVMICVHALYKGALFLVAGIVDRATGTRDVERLGGLGRAMPWTFAAAALAGLSMAGLPPLFGFVGKELAYKAKLGFDLGEPVVPLVAVVTNALGVAAASVVALRPFVGAGGVAAAARPGAMLVAPPFLLGLTGLVLGADPALLGGLVEPAATAVLGRPSGVTLEPFYGFGAAFQLSLVTVGAGVVAAIVAPTVRRRLAPTLARLGRVGPASSRALAAVVSGAGRWVDAPSRRRFGRQVAIALLALLALSALVIGAEPPRLELSGIRPPRPEELVLAGLAIAGAAIAATARHRLTAVLAVGVVGVAAALVFMSLGAVDVALTQLLVETLVVVAMAHVLSRMRPRSPVDAPGRPRALGAAVLACGVGALMAIATFAVATSPGRRDVSRWLVAHSVPAGRGENVVNVILVDFRALDTLGEIVVLTAAALGVAALLRTARAPKEAT